jgi:predicted metal-dependent peptidase
MDYIKAKQELERAITQMRAGKLAFVGATLQSLECGFSSRVPTAGVRFNSEAKTFGLLINPEFFLEKLNLDERIAVLTHEIYHILHKHVYYMPEKRQDQLKTNVAMDLVINQLIENLPEGAMLIENFRDKDKKPFPKNRQFEVYYDLLNDAETRKNSSSEWEKLEDAFQGREGSPFDSHEFDLGDQDESALKDKLQAVKDLFKRSLDKVSNDHSLVPGGVNELLEAITAQLKKLDTKAILLAALKASSPASIRKRTWKRQSRRWGDMAPGSKMGEMPKFYVLLDTSGSISVKEANEFFRVTNDFLTVGVDKTTIGFFHTELYHEERVKRNFNLEPIRHKIQGGGTDLTDAFKKLKLKKNDMVIVLTDGYFPMPEVDLRGFPELVFVISANGTLDHPLKHIGKTVKNV